MQQSIVHYVALLCLLYEHLVSIAHLAMVAILAWIFGVIDCLLIDGSIQVDCGYNVHHLFDLNKRRDCLALHIF